MSDTAWIALFAAIPPSLLALATLIAVSRGMIKISNLHDLIDGRFSEMLSVVKVNSKLEGKVETLEKVIAPTTTVVTDRRKDNGSS